MEAIVQANDSHQPSYGADRYTHEAENCFKACFGDDVQVFFVYNGTGANVLSLSALARPHHAVFCTNAAHIYEDECGAPEKATGCKLISVPHVQGKLLPERLLPFLEWLGDEHRVQPRVISITQSTEFGTSYSVQEILAISDFCRTHKLYLHMDGARIANAAVYLNLDLCSATRHLGVDVLSFGGTKNGLLAGEAVVFFNPELAEEAKYQRKQLMHLHSKMRYLSAQFIPYFKNELWKQNAQHANHMAQLLRTLLENHPHIHFPYPTQANGVFAQIPESVTARLQAEFPFYIFDSSINLARFMCSWDTTEENIRQFAQAIHRSLDSVHT
jgi:threonine aldolase